MESKIVELKKKFIEIYGGGNDIRIFRAPGRVNLIGEHIDYNGGKVLPVALTMGTTLLVRENGSGIVRMAATDLEDRPVVDLERIEETGPIGWGSYQAGVMYEMKRRGYMLTGLDMLFDDEIPHGCGLSSSAAIEVSCALAIASYSSTTPPDMVELAKISQVAENEFVGLSCGIMDQFSSAMGRENCAMLLDCATLDCEYIPLALGEYKIVIANTNKKRSLSDSKYNERHAECAQALDQLRSELPGLESLCVLTPELFDEHCGSIEDETVYRRARHAVYENQRVLSSVELLRKGDIEAFGQLMIESHDSLKNMYEVSCPELDAMVEEAKVLEGCVGARMTGAGFGGCTVNIVRGSLIGSFIRELGERYMARTGLEPEFYVSGAGGGAHEVR